MRPFFMCSGCWVIKVDIKGPAIQSEFKVRRLMKEAQLLVESH